MTCSKCEDLSSHSIIVHEGEPPKDPKEKDKRGVRVIRFCKEHWRDIEKHLP